MDHYLQKNFIKALKKRINFGIFLKDKLMDNSITIKIYK